ncbi:MAG: hypothetical protein RJA70_1484 [Pseudomonadota bacterium]|jgi:hypothetical protein
MNNKSKIIIIAAFLVLLGVGGYIASVLEAIEVGGSCANTSQRDSCAGPGAACITADSGNYCSITCKQAAECPAGWACRDIASETYSGKTGEKTDSAAVSMCVKP